MKFNLIDDWQWVLKEAWSIRLTLLSGLFGGLEVILPLFVDSMPRGVFATLSVLTAIASGAARVIAQRREDGNE
jgi:hypothetical protein